MPLCGMPHSHVRCAWFVCATWRIHMCYMTPSYVRHDAFICVAWLIRVCGMLHSYVWHDACICVAKYIHLCDMTPSCVRRDSFLCVTWLIHTCDMTHSYVGLDSFICVTWLIHRCNVTPLRCDMPRSRVQHDFVLQNSPKDKPRLPKYLELLAPSTSHDLKEWCVYKSRTQRVHHIWEILCSCEWCVQLPCAHGMYKLGFSHPVLKSDR